MSGLVNDAIYYLQGASSWLGEQYTWASDATYRTYSEFSEWFGPMSYSPPRPLLGIARYPDEEEKEKPIVLNPFELDEIAKIFLSTVFYETEEQLKTLKLSSSHREILHMKSFSSNENIPRSMLDQNAFYLDAMTRKNVFLSQEEMGNKRLSQKQIREITNEVQSQREKYMSFWLEHYVPSSYFPNFVKRVFSFIQKRNPTKILLFVKRILCFLLPSYFQMLKDYDHLLLLERRNRFFAHFLSEGYKKGLQRRIDLRKKQ